jgi:hypothetical protein
MTASATHNREMSWGNWQTTLAFGRSKCETPPLPVMLLDTLDDVLGVSQSAIGVMTTGGYSWLAILRKALWFS